MKRGRIHDRQLHSDFGRPIHVLTPYFCVINGDVKNIYWVIDVADLTGASRF